MEPGRHADGGGLYLVIDGDGRSADRRRWLFLFQWRGKRREMGLGGYPAVSLADARKVRDEAEKILRDGRDPIIVRDEVRRARERTPTFAEAAEALIEAMQSGWRNPKHRAQWDSTLRTYCKPFWSTPVNEVGTDAIVGVLKAIWTTKAETASRVRGRIEAVIDAARAAGHIPPNEANPARWRGHLDKLLSRRQKLKRGHHRAMRHVDLSAFIADLRRRNAIAALALEFLILAAARSGEVRDMRWSEVSLAERLWTVPAARMKAGRKHRVPLSSRAMEILEAVQPLSCQGENDPLVFPGQKLGKPLSIMSMTMLLRRMELDVTVHGFRSAFRDFAGDETSFAREVAEAALAHLIGDKAEQAYRRSDALAKRRRLMEAWAAYIEPKQDDESGVAKASAASSYETA
jgi:integrase